MKIPKAHYRLTIRQTEKQQFKRKAISKFFPNVCPGPTVDYGFGLLTLSKTQLQRLDVIQNEGMRAILGCTKDTAAAAMRYVLGLPAMKERHKLAQVKAYLKVCADTKA